jgi:hypothetical protein
MTKLRDAALDRIQRPLGNPQFIAGWSLELSQLANGFVSSESMRRQFSGVIKFYVATNLRTDRSRRTRPHALIFRTVRVLISAGSDADRNTDRNNA